MQRIFIDLAADLTFKTFHRFPPWAISTKKDIYSVFTGHHLFRILAQQKLLSKSTKIPNGFKKVWTLVNIIVTGFIEWLKMQSIM